jgi:hypothetical protein
MSVISVGRKPRALIRPLRAGNSRAGARPGQLRAGEPGTAASRPEKPDFPGGRVPAQPDSSVPSRPRSARNTPARPRLWVVPDAPGTAGPATSEPGISDSGSSRPGVLRPAAPGSRTPGDAPVRPPVGAGSAPLVPRPRVAPDDQIQSHPAIPAPSRPRRAGRPAVQSGTRVVRAASASRVPAGRVRRTRLTRRGRRLVWASAVLLLVAVITPVLLAVASGAQAANHGVPPSMVRAAMRQVVVKPGQSLWSIALNAEPQADPRVVSQQIMDFNALGSQVVVPGESLWVPKG